MRRLSMLVLLVPLALPGTAEAIRGPTAARLVARTTEDRIVGDGARWVVFRRSEQRAATLLDAATGRERPLPAGCTAVDAIQSVFLLRCGPDDRPVLLFPDRRELRRPTSVRPGDEFGSVGRYWIAGARDAAAQPCPPDDSCDVGTPVRVFVNWRTGDRRSCDQHGEGSCDFDLNRRTLVRAGSGARHGRTTGWATWITYTPPRPPELHAYSLSSGRHLRWVIPARRANAVHTDHRAFVQTADRLYELALPA